MRKLDATAKDTQPVHGKGKTSQEPGCLNGCSFPKGTVPDFSRMSMKADPGMEELVNPMCPLLWQLRRLS